MTGTGFSLTVLGAGPACPNEGGACSGYLLRQDGQGVLVDCGSGIVGRLRQHVPLHEVSAIAISHLHPDHCFDLVPLYYGLKYGPRGGSHRTPDGRTPLYLPPGSGPYLRTLQDAANSAECTLDEVYAVREYSADPRAETRIGPFTFSFHPVQHYLPSHAMRIAGHAGRVLVFSADAGPCQALVEAARDADLFLCEASMAGPYEDHPQPERRGHLQASEAGAIARQAGARRLLLTHYRRDGGALEAHHLANARATFGGPVELAQEGATYSV